MSADMGDAEGSATTLILNPVAGGIGSEEERARIMEAARARGFRVLETREAGDATRLAAEARHRGVAQVVVGGGDGTIHEIVQGLLSLQGEAAPSLPTLSVLPLGTGNDLARCLELPLHWEAALEFTGGKGRTRQLDLMDVSLDGTSVVGLNAVVVGSGGRVGRVLDPDRKAWWGPLSYLRSAAEVLLELEPRRVHLTLEEAPRQTLEVLNVVVANGRFAARGVPVAPGADPFDGVLDAVTIQGSGLSDVIAMAPTLLRGEDPQHPAYARAQVRSVRIEAVGPDALPVSIDGENRSARSVRVTVRPATLPVRVPS